MGAYNIRCAKYHVHFFIFCSFYLNLCCVPWCDRVRIKIIIIIIIIIIIHYATARRGLKLTTIWSSVRLAIHYATTTLYTKLWSWATNVKKPVEEKKINNITSIRKCRCQSRLRCSNKQEAVIDSCPSCAIAAARVCRHADP